MLQDLTRMRELARRTGIETYLGVLITDKARSKLAGHREKLEAVLARPADVPGTLVHAGGGDAKWEWCFACRAFPPHPRRVDSVYSVAPPPGGPCTTSTRSFGRSHLWNAACTCSAVVS